MEYNMHGSVALYYKKPVLFLMSPKIVDVLLDINIFKKEMWKNIRMNRTL